MKNNKSPLIKYRTGYLMRIIIVAIALCIPVCVVLALSSLMKSADKSVDNSAIQSASDSSYVESIVEIIDETETSYVESSNTTMATEQSTESAAELTSTESGTVTTTSSTTVVNAVPQRTNIITTLAGRSATTTTTTTESVVTAATTTDKKTDKKTAKKSETTAKKSESVTVTSVAMPVEKCYSEQDIRDIAKVMYRECGCLPSKTEQACVAWTILNRCDNWGKTVYEIVRAPYQYAFNSNSPVTDALYDLAKDVLDRWSREKNGETNAGRVLPLEYMWFWGDGHHNHFRNAYQRPYTIWRYTLPSPYES